MCRETGAANHDGSSICQSNERLLSDGSGLAALRDSAGRKEEVGQSRGVLGNPCGGAEDGAAEERAEAEEEGCKGVARAKTCNECGITKELDRFTVNKGGTLGRMAKCKDCRAAQQRAWKKSHPEYAHEYIRKNRSRIYGQKRRANSTYNQKLRIKLRLLVLQEYGGRCACCGETTYEFLGIDHIYNDGAAHRKEIGKGNNIYPWLRDNGFPKDRFQILCHNCNFAKGHYGRCPHTKEEKAA